MTETKTKKTDKHTTSIVMTDAITRQFGVIRQSMSAALPGIEPSNQDILRHALHLAATAAEHKAQTQPF